MEVFLALVFGIVFILLLFLGLAAFFDNLSQPPTGNDAYDVSSM